MHVRLNLMQTNTTGERRPSSAVGEGVEALCEGSILGGAVVADCIVFS